jgi:NDP-sugar pyrophosphorylase family protein
MHAVILAGGKGTRLRPYTTCLPKPLVPVGEQPILSIIVRQLKEAGVKRVTLAVDHLAELIMAFFGNGQKYGVEIDYSLDPFPLGTVGPVRLIKNLPEHFLVMNGDTLTDLPYEKVFRSHLSAGANLTIARFRRKVPVDFGVLTLDERSHRVVGFEEKPIQFLDVSMGIYVFSRKLLKRIPADTPYGLDDLVLGMLADSDPINTFPHDGHWLDLGRPDDYDKANNGAFLRA